MDRSKLVNSGNDLPPFRPSATYPSDPITDARSVSLLRLIEQPKAHGLTSFFPAVVFYGSVGMSLAFLPGMVAVLVHSMITNGKLQDSVDGTFLCLVATDLAFLLLLVSCRVTVRRLRKFNLQTYSDNRQHGKESIGISFWGRIVSPDIGRRRALLSPSEVSIGSVLPMRGSWSRLFLELTISVSGLSVIKYFLVFLVVPLSATAAEVLNGIVQFGFATLVLKIFVEGPSNRLPMEQWRSAVLTSLNLCAIVAVVRVFITSVIYASFLAQDYLMRVIWVQFVFDSISIFLCFYLPDIRLFRLIFLRSLAPAVTKIAAVFYSPLVSTSPFVHLPGGTEKSSYPSRLDSDDRLELEFSATTLANFGLCVRQLLCFTSRAGMALRLDVKTYYFTIAVGLVWQWAFTALCLWRIRYTVGKACTTGYSSSNDVSMMQLMHPIADFKALIESKNQARQVSSEIHSDATSANSSNMQSWEDETCNEVLLPSCRSDVSVLPNSPYSQNSRLRLLALSHYLVTLGYVRGAFAGTCFAIIYLMLARGADRTFRSIVVDDLPLPTGQGLAVGIFPAIEYQTASLWIFVVISDVVVNSVMAWWMARCGDVCYGADDHFLDLLWRRKKVEDNSRLHDGWDPRDYIGSATEILICIPIYLLAAGCVIQGITGFAK
ncbi:hypothetical protein DFJ73DRAFT_866203 [Zopfochytrium polystomum]|nr:hypothetical protein DFJ73DRAFT_866203 [Zopfochytrium polystomum]